MAKLKDIFTLQMGKTPARAKGEYWNNGDNNWVSISDLSTFDKYVGNTRETISDLAVKDSGIKPVPADTVIMSFKLTLGKTAITVKPTYTNEAIMAFVPNGKYPVFPSYFYHFFGGRDWSIGTNRAVMGITLNKATLGEIDVATPSIEEQIKIAEHLDKVDELISYRKEQLTKLDELVKSRFVELFGDPKYNKSNLVKIGEIGALTSGGTPSRAKPEYFEGDIRWYSAGELNSLYLPDSVEHISERALQQSSAKLFNKGTLMIGMYDTAAFKMGILTEDSSSNQACANLNPKQGYNIVWLYYLFDIMKPIFLQERQGVRQKNLSLSKIKEFEVPFAPFELQERFAAFVEQTDKSKLEIQKSLEKLETLKKALMQKYFG